MIHLLAFYLLLGALVLSGIHSVRVIRRSAARPLDVEAALAARREKKVLIFAGGLTGAYVLTVVILQFFLSGTAFLIVLAPFLYLVLFLLGRWIPWPPPR
jgi:hypothetical protein